MGTFPALGWPSGYLIVQKTSLLVSSSRRKVPCGCAATISPSFSTTRVYLAASSLFLVAYRCLRASCIFGFARVAARKPLKMDPAGLIALTLTKEFLPTMFSMSSYSMRSESMKTPPSL